VAGSGVVSSYAWSAGLAGNVSGGAVSPAATTTYNVTVTNSNACTVSGSVTVTVNALPVPSASNTGPYCSSNSIQLNSSGGTNYNWSGPNSYTSSVQNPSIANSTVGMSGIYSVTVTDGNGCTATASTTVTVIPGMNLSTTVTNVSCNGVNNGAVTLAVGGGQAPFVFLWSNGVATQNISNLLANTYTVTVTDNVGCSATISASVTQPATLSITQTHTDVLCNGGTDGTITTTTSGGTSPYTYLWNDGNTNANRTNLIIGTYTVTVTDNHNCTASVSATIAQPGLLSVSETHTDVSCFGGSNGTITTNAVGGTSPYTYLWNDGNTNANRTNLIIGTYTVTVTDNHSCTASINATLAQPTALGISETHTDVLCNGGTDGTITTTTSGGTSPYSYLWNDGNTNANRTNLIIGTYTITITDNHSCTASISVTLAQPTALGISETHTDVLCNGGTDGTITTTTSGGTSPYSYLWNDGNTNANRTNLIIGTYTVTVTDNHSCTASVSATIAQPGLLSVSEIHTDVSCFGGSNGTITTNTVGGTSPYSYLWNDGNTNANRTNLIIGTYSVTVTDNHSCTASISATLAQPTALGISETHTDVLCNGGTDGTITTTTSGGTSPYTYLWNDGNTNANRTNLIIGTYTVTVTDNHNCTASISATLAQPTALGISETHTDVLCNGGTDGTITTTTSGGTSPYTYLWNDGNINANRTNLIIGTYTVTVTDNHSCTASVSATIAQPGLLSVSETHTDVSCFGGSNGTAIASGNSGSPGYTYLWSTGSVSSFISNLTAGSYTVTITDTHNCTASVTASIIQPAGMTFTDTVINPTCPTLPDNGNITLYITGGTMPYNFSWNNGNYGAVAYPLAPGNYSVTVTDAGGCTITSAYTLSYLFDFTIDASPSVSIDLGESTTLDYTLFGNAGNYWNSWSPSGPLSCSDCVSPIAAPIVTTLFHILVTNDYGCTASDTVTVYVNPVYSIFIPNVFTPNGDGNNDFFEVFGKKEAWKQFEVEVFDRWGERVYQSNDMNFKWDGQYKGKDLPPAVFVYQIHLTYLDNYTDKLFKGSVTLVR
jgi:gliding motility-associated-like protein